MDRYKNKQIEKFLLENLPTEEIKNCFKEKLKKVSNENYYQIISEMRAICIFTRKLKLSIAGINVKTINNKDVDFVVNFEGKRIYCEVKGSQPIESNETGYWMTQGILPNIDRAFRKSRKKFLERVFNILIIADENILKIPGVNNPFYIGSLKSFFNLSENERISAVMLLSEQSYKQSYEGLLNYSIFYNHYTQKDLPQALKAILNKYSLNNE